MIFVLFIVLVTVIRCGFIAHDGLKEMNENFRGAKDQKRKNEIYKITNKL